MAWQLLPVNYKDAAWAGLKKYAQVDNEDGTVSFQDVTVYSNKELSFFGAKDANRMNEALNTIMSMVENGTDLYGAFQLYFGEQKVLFEGEANSDLLAFEEYINGLSKHGMELLDQLQSDYTANIGQFESNQKALFDIWFATIRNQLSQDAAGHLQNEVDDLKLKTDGFVNKTTTFSTDGTTITEVSGVQRKVSVFNADGSITEKLYEGNTLISEKLTTFSADGVEIKEVLQ